MENLWKTYGKPMGREDMYYIFPSKPYSFHKSLIKRCENELFYDKAPRQFLSGWRRAAASQLDPRGPPFKTIGNPCVFRHRLRKSAGGQGPPDADLIVIGKTL